MIIITLILLVSVISSTFVLSDDDRWEHYRQQSIGVANINNPLYQEECGSCHMAYQPGLLTAASWNRLMQGLDQHFGDNAELDKETLLLISNYLQSNSADQSAYRRSRKFARYVNINNPPIRISQTPYFLHKHDEIPVKMVTANDKIKSFSQCNACHQRAQQGLYDEHGVVIPGYGRWED